MTTIAALKHRGKVYVAADRRITYGSQYHRSPVSKICKRNGVIIAGAGNASLTLEIVNNLVIPKVEDDTYYYVYTILYNKILSFLKKKGLLNKEGILTLPEDFSLYILVAVKGEVFIIETSNNNDVEWKSATLDVIPVSLPYCCGSGGDYARGSLDTTEHLEWKPKDRLVEAIRVASNNNQESDTSIDIEHE